MCSSPRLLVYSFHSVKGGVGKSSLSVACARTLAEALVSREIPVILMDMDLTGTSLADVLSLQAPAWDAATGPELQLASLGEPTRWMPPEETRTRIEQRQQHMLERRGEDATQGHRALYLPFLNDFFLHADRHWRSGQDIRPSRLLWRSVEEPHFDVLPSSALPNDLEQILPLIYDEERAAFLEGRLEQLLSHLLEEYPKLALVVDTPPTLPGLSRTVLSLALRLGREHRLPLAIDGELPPRLKDAEIHWHAQLVASPDLQDLRALFRWLELVQPDEQPVLQFLINRGPREPGDQQRLLEGALGTNLNALAASPLWMPEHASLQQFGLTASERRDHPAPEALRSFLEPELNWLHEERSP